MAGLLDTPEDLEPLQAALGRGLKRVEERVAGALVSELPAVQRLCEHIEQYHGKMIRPMLVILSGLACGGGRAGDKGEIPDAHITLAAVCEMVHLATLVHDDVLDEADTRRKAVTVNRLSGNEAAVMLGDYVFSAAFTLCASLGDRATTEEIGRTGMTLCSGELLQLFNRGNLSLEEPTYYALVERKTASLIATAAALGARHAGAEAETVERLRRFGTKLGVAFQIQDDLLDLTGDQAVVGKPLGKDMEKGKMTLPVIHHLAASPPHLRGRTLQLLDAAGEEGHSREQLGRALAATGSIEHARRVAEGLISEAREALRPLPETPAKRLLLLMAEAVVSRAY